MLNLSNACSHLQNATKARLGLTSLPNTKYNLAFALALHRAGLISSVTRGGPQPPSQEQLLSAETETELQPPSLEQLLSAETETELHPRSQEQLLPAETEPVTSANVATRRLWLGLKYWNNKPVMSRLQMISKPSRPVTIKLPHLERITRGLPSGLQPGLNLGENMFLGTDRGVLESREATAKKCGGLLICRVS